MGVYSWARKAVRQDFHPSCTRFCAAGRRLQVRARAAGRARKGAGFPYPRRPVRPSLPMEVTLPEPVEPQDGAGERCVAEAGGPGWAAFAEWLERQRPELLAHLARRLSPALRRRVQAEDILQEAVLEALRAPARLARCGGEGLRAWVLAIAENQIRLAARRARPRSRPRRTTPLADGLVRHDVEL